MNQILIYTRKTSNRLTYILDFLFGELMGLQYELTTDKEAFTKHTEAKISYASAPLGDEIFFEAVDFLFEKGINLQPIDFVDYENVTGFYLVSKRSRLPFDLFASAFVMLSGYNEHLLNKKDKYDRYRASQSLNYKAGFLEKPMIDYYALLLKKIIGERYSQLNFKKRKFEYIATFDVDMAYSFLEKGFGLNLGGFMRAFLLSDFKDIKMRYEVIFGGKQDPFDTYDYIWDTCNKRGIKTRFFFLVGDRSKFDKNISHESEMFQNLIKDISAKTDVGIHLSFQSHISNGVMMGEIKRLEDITGKKITTNRFHYLRFTLPASYMRLIKIGIKEDYSMGYATRIGFRAGTCTPYPYYNLSKEEVGDLKIFPFAFMDTTLAHYNRISSRASIERIRQVMQYVKEVEGPCIGLWHNSSFIEDGQWKGWRDVFETISKEGAKLMEEE